MDTYRLAQIHLKLRILMGGAATSSFDNTVPSASACSGWSMWSHMMVMCLVLQV